MNDFSWLSDLGAIGVLCVAIVIMAIAIYQLTKRKNGYDKSKSNISDTLANDLDEAFNRLWTMESHCAKTQKEFEHRLSTIEANFKNLDDKVDNVSADVKYIRKILDNK